MNAFRDYIPVNQSGHICDNRYERRLHEHSTVNTAAYWDSWAEVLHISLDIKYCQRVGQIGAEFGDITAVVTKVD